MDDSSSASLQSEIEAPITASLGAMGPALRRLRSITASDQYRVLKGVIQAEIQLLGEGLEELCRDFKVVSEAEDASFTAKCWLSSVRELLYDTEDYLDEAMQSMASVRRRAPVRIIFRRKEGITFQIPKRISLPRKRNLKWSSSQIAKKFSELVARVEEASERRQRFQLGPKTIKSDIFGQACVSRLTPKQSLELLVGTANKLVKLLGFEHDEKKQLKVLPIFGFAGVGKTTVARMLYRTHEGKFQCRAFVRVSRNPDLRRLLTSILSQIKGPRARGFSDLQDLIDATREHLQGKRYLIIVDDIWTTSLWDIISRAFPYGNCSSRIIATTEIEDVALACSSYQSEYIFKMGPLNDDQSERIFYNRVYWSEGEASYSKDSGEASDAIIVEYGRSSLATINTMDLLGRERNFIEERWENIQDSLPSTLTTHHSSEGMEEVVKFIYYNLPSHLKTCLLYLSMYPEGYIVRKDELVNQWVAEGFLCDMEEEEEEETARSYFDELVSRGMIQPVDTTYNDEVLSCTLHHIVLDLMKHESVEQNFITIVDNTQTTLGFSDKVRRLSVQFGGAKCGNIPASWRISKIRSLLFCGFFKCVPPILEYGLLRVLILHIWSDQEDMSFDLTRICVLLRLRNIKIESNMTIQLPKKIVGLRFLGRLQVDAKLSAIPSDIVHLQSLLHLRFPSEAILPHGIGHMTSLRTLGYFDLSSSNSQDNVMDLGKLTNLQDLHLTCSTLENDNLDKNMKCLGSILGKLSSLRCLTLVPSSSSHVNILDDGVALSLRNSCDGFSIVSPPPALLERLELSWHCCIFSSLPEWIGKLRKLDILNIAVKGLSTNDVNILQVLPVLTALSLYVQTAPAEWIVFGKVGFSVLKYLKFRCTVPLVKFEADAMPDLRKLKLVFNGHGLDQHDTAPMGVEHLSGLEEISAKIGGASADAQFGFMATTSSHPNNPRSSVQLMDRIYYGDTSMRTKGRRHVTQDEGKWEADEIQAENRISTLPEFSSRPDIPGSFPFHRGSPATKAMSQGGHQQGLCFPGPGR